MNCIIFFVPTNRYGHPADEAIERIEAEESDIFYTMYGGQIRVTVKGEDIVVSTVSK